MNGKGDHQPEEQRLQHDLSIPHERPPGELPARAIVSPVAAVDAGSAARHTGGMTRPTPAAPTAAPFVDHHRQLLRFVERRVGSREAAEDILHDVLARNLSRLEELPDEARLPWLFRVLRHAIIDARRRSGARTRALDAFAREHAARVATLPAEAPRQCACVGRLVRTLKPEYAEALQAVDVEGTPVKAWAAVRGLTASNAGVRIMRARRALRRLVAHRCGACAERACVDCSCTHG